MISKKPFSSSAAAHCAWSFGKNPIENSVRGRVYGSVLSFMWHAVDASLYDSVDVTMQDFVRIRISYPMYETMSYVTIAAKLNEYEFNKPN